MSKLYGFVVTRADVVLAKRVLNHAGPNLRPKDVNTHAPDLIPLFCNLRNFTTRASTRMLLDLIALPSGCPKCVCGKEDVHKFSGYGPKDCNQPSTCEEFRRITSNKKRETRGLVV
jgi:hypothetical protein